MPQKPDRFVALSTELLRQLAAFDVALLDEPAQDIAAQESARIKLVADLLRLEFGLAKQ
jgi:hypothetical protein